jgi:hypothetical protein
MRDRETKGGYASGDRTVSELGPIPEALTRPAHHSAAPAPDLQEAIPAKYHVGQAVRMRTGQPDYVSGPVITVEPPNATHAGPVYTVDLYGAGPAHRVRALESQITAAEEPVPPAPRVPDLPCPKCGHTGVSIAYCDACDRRPYTSSIRKYEDDYCSHGDVDHFHRACRRCTYRWKTEDALNPRRVCDR